MKRILLALATIFSVGAANAQMASGSLAPDFTGTDLDGNTHNLYDYLQQGYTVVVDVSATWCGPCWNYHNSGALETLWEEHGIENDGSVVVLFVEGDGTTTNADLNGTGGNTQGNWVSGTGYPIIDDASIGDLLEIAYFPTIYTICPNGIITETGQITADAHWAFIENNTCQTVASDDATALNYTGDNVTCGDAALSFQLANLGTNPLTAATITVTGVTPMITYNWTGNLDQFESEMVDLGTGTVTGNVVITVNAAGDGVATNNALNADIAMATEATTHFIINLRFDNWPEEVSWEFKDENGAVVESSPSYASQTDGAIIYGDVFLPSTGCYSFTIADAYGDGMNGSIYGGATNVGNGYCYVHSLDNSGNQVSTIFSYDGSTQYDEATVGANVNQTVGIDEISAATAFGVYPNPTSSMTNVNYTLASEATVTIEVVNMLGERVVSENKGTQQAGTYNNQIDFSNLNAGIYMINFNVDGVVSTTRLTVAK
jgi:hypothetical protein